jgi:hypothetical protein
MKRPAQGNNSLRRLVKKTYRNSNERVHKTPYPGNNRPRLLTRGRTR